MKKNLLFAFTCFFVFSLFGCKQLTDALTPQTPATCTITSLNDNPTCSVSSSEIYVNTADPTNVVLQVTVTSTASQIMSVFNPPDGDVFMYFANISAGTSTLTIPIPTSKLATNQKITVKFRQTTDVADDGTNCSWAFFNITGTPSSLTQKTIPADVTLIDTSPPKVVSVTPTNGGTGINSITTTKITVVFDKPMNEDGYSFCGAGGTFPPHGSPVWINDTTIDYPVFLNPNMTYTLSLNTLVYKGFKDTNGNMLEPYIWTFTTASSGDNTPPTVVSITPSNNSSSLDASTTTKMTIVFSEAMRGGYSFCSVSGQNYPTIIGTPTWISSTTVECQITVSPNTTYAGSLNTTVYKNFKDLNGNPLEPVPWTFSTAPDTTAPSIVSFSPADGATNIDPNITTLTVVFNEPMSGGSSFCNVVGYDCPSGEVTWINNTTVEWSVMLDPSTEYKIDFYNRFSIPATPYTHFKDSAGNPLPETVWTFTTAAP